MFDTIPILKMNCQFCSSLLTDPTLTRCCKSVICRDCRQRLEAKLVCLCGKPVPPGKKSTIQQPQLINTLNSFAQRKVKECDRCQKPTQMQCNSCGMSFCGQCDTEVHAAAGFAKHIRTAYVHKPASIIRQEKDLICNLHGQSLQIGCQCGSSLCISCLKTHKQSCPKGGKTRPWKEHKQQYFGSVLVKMRQLGYYQKALQKQRQQLKTHFSRQKKVFDDSFRAITQQFQYLRQVLQVKQKQFKSRLEQYWDSCCKVHEQNIYRSQIQSGKYDQMGQLLQHFADNMTNLQYFQNKIRRFNLPLQFVSAKVNGIEQVAAALMNISLSSQPWQSAQIKQAQDKPTIKQQNILLPKTGRVSQLLLQYGQKPLEPRQLTLSTSHSQIHYTFIDLPYQHLSYQIQYGVGMKMKGIQIFKAIPNKTGIGCIQGLNPNTKYRVRMRVVGGQWGTVQQAMTLDIPKFNLENSLWVKASSQGLHLGKGGFVYGTNQINFGQHRWVIKLIPKTISCQSSQTACVSVGVANRQSKRVAFVGTTFNYGYQRSQILLRVLLDCGERRLVISNSVSGQQEVYQDLPGMPLFPAIQNKGNSQMVVKYSLTTDDPTCC